MEERQRSVDQSGEEQTQLLLRASRVAPLGTRGVQALCWAVTGTPALPLGTESQETDALTTPCPHRHGLRASPFLGHQSLSSPEVFSAGPLGRSEGVVLHRLPLSTHKDASTKPQARACFTARAGKCCWSSGSRQTHGQPRVTSDGTGSRKTPGGIPSASRTEHGRT